MKKNTLYTVNRWNTLGLLPERKNLFYTGGPTGALSVKLSQPTVTPYINWSNPVQRGMALATTEYMANNVGNAGALTAAQSNQLLSESLGSLSEGAAEGATSSVGSIMPYLSVAMGAANAIKDYTNLKKISDISGYMNAYEDFGNQTYSGNFNDIIGQKKSSSVVKAPTWKEIRGISGSGKANAIISGVANGAMAGSSFGPWGALAGAVIGGGASAFGVSEGDKEAKREANRLQVARLQAIEDNQNAYVLGMRNAAADANRMQMMNISALGGLLYHNKYKNTFDEGGLKAAFLDDFNENPLGAVVRYNKGLEELAAQKEAEQVALAKEQEYDDLLSRVSSLETENQGLQAIMSALPTYTPSVPDIPEESEYISDSFTADDYDPSNSTWNYIKGQLKKSGKFNDIQIEGIKQTIKRESGFGYNKKGDAGKAFGLLQWHPDRQPKDKSLKGQTEHMINTLSYFDGGKHWIGEGNYKGFINARTPEEAHYYIAKGYERPDEKFVEDLRRKSEASLKRLRAKDRKSLAFGGELGTNGADFTNGLTYIDEGGSHEENPLEGVPVGIDPQGIPNLVEEGETIYNNYVFSKRLDVPDFMLKDLGLPKSKKKVSFAEASKKLAKESEQRPNDPISQDGLKASLSKLAEVQEAVRLKNQYKEYEGLQKYACGGNMKNKYDGKNVNGQRFTPYGYDKMEDFKYWDTSTGDYDIGYRGFIEEALDDNWIAKVMSGKYGDMSRYKKNNNFNPTVGEAIQLGLDYKNSDWHKAMAAAYDNYKKEQEAKLAQTRGFDPVAEGLIDASEVEGTPAVTPTPEDGNNSMQPKKYDTWMRYAPAVGNGLMVLSDLAGITNKPDYSQADALAAYARRAGVAPNVKAEYVGNYLRPHKFDKMYYANQLAAQAAATRKAVSNLSGGNRGTKIMGLLAADANAQNALGNLYRQAEEYQLGADERVEDFNRRTNMFNSQMGLEAAIANARYQQTAKQLGLSGLAQAAALRNQIDANVGAARSANLTNFLTSLGNIGRENFALNQLNLDPSRKYSMDNTGATTYKKNTQEKSKKRFSLNNLFKSKKKTK